MSLGGRPETVISFLIQKNWLGRFEPQGMTLFSELVISP